MSKAFSYLAKGNGTQPKKQKTKNQQQQQITNETSSLMSVKMVEPCAVPSIYCGPNSKSAARHLKNQKARRVRFALHVRETLIEEGSWPDSRNSSFSKSASTVHRKSERSEGEAAATDVSGCTVSLNPNVQGGVMSSSRAGRFLLSIIQSLKSVVLGRLIGRNKSSTFSRRALFITALGLVSFIIFRVLLNRGGAFASAGNAPEASTVVKSVVRKKVTRAPLLKL